VCLGPLGARERHGAGGKNPRARPLDWASTQNNLGNALRALGGRESGTARLEEALAAFRVALEERTRERVPLQWAGTQNNLGSALSTFYGKCSHNYYFE
jgi:predicted component of type VI protein secretion system